MRSRILYPLHAEEIHFTEPLWMRIETMAYLNIPWYDYNEHQNYPYDPVLLRQSNKSVKSSPLADEAVDLYTARYNNTPTRKFFVGLMGNAACLPRTKCK